MIQDISSGHRQRMPHTSPPSLWMANVTLYKLTRARFLSLARSKLRLCSANHRAGYWSNLACDWLSIVWAYSEQETENGPCFTGPTVHLLDDPHNRVVWGIMCIISGWCVYLCNELWREYQKMVVSMKFVKCYRYGISSIICQTGQFID